MDKTFLLTGAGAGFLAVALGAFGAHGLRARVWPGMLAVLDAGVRDHVYHAVAILLVGVIGARLDGWLIRAGGWCFAAGVVLFSGSLYALAISGITVFGAITPIGGLAFLLGWALLVVAAVL